MINDRSSWSQYLKIGKIENKGDETCYPGFSGHWNANLVDKFHHEKK